MTKTIAFETLRTLVENADEDIQSELYDFIDTQLAQLEKRSAKAKERAATKEPKEDPLYDVVVAILKDNGKEMLPADIAAQIESDEDITVPKVRARCVKAVKNGVAKKVEVLVESKVYVGYAIA